MVNEGINDGSTCMPRTIHKGGTWGPILNDGVAHDGAPSYAAAAFPPWPDAAAFANHLLHVHALIDAPDHVLPRSKRPWLTHTGPNTPRCRGALS
jgi:hypothetical protein